MRFDLLTILDHIGMIDDVLYRKLRSGQVRRITAIENGNLVVMIDGQRYYGPELAWACHYHAVPRYPVVCIDGNPENLSKDNLGAVRTRRLKMRITPVAGGFKHPLVKLVFPSPEKARLDWVRRAQQFYHSDMVHVLAEQERLAPKHAPESLLARSIERHKPTYVPTRLPKQRTTPRKVPPAPVPGRVWFWYKDQYLSLPEAVHPSDDIVLRAEAVLQNPAAVMRYDPVLDRTVVHS